MNTSDIEFVGEVAGDPSLSKKPVKEEEHANDDNVVASSTATPKSIVKVHKNQMKNESKKSGIAAAKKKKKTVQKATKEPSLKSSAKETPFISKQHSSAANNELVIEKLRRENKKLRTSLKYLKKRAKSGDLVLENAEDYYLMQDPDFVVDNDTIYYDSDASEEEKDKEEEQQNKDGVHKNDIKSERVDMSFGLDNCHVSFCE